MGNRDKVYGLFGRWSRNHLMIIAGVALVVLALLIILAVSLSFDLELSVNGGTETLQLVYGKDTYQEAGATATANGKEVEVTISNTVDMEKLGTYEVTYKAKYLWLTKTAVRKVQVVDTTAPVITLKTVPGQLTLPGEEYQEEGYTAIDDYDGDITDKVTTRTENDIVYYTVVDSSGNETTVERQIARTDITPPTITLVGDANMTIQAGSTYTDPGYTALDNIDGDITDKVEISGSVNIYHADTYIVTYTVTDSYGNTGTAQRTVTVQPIKQPSTVAPDGKVIYLTFDDGPSKYTTELLNILEQYNAKATFFVVNTGYSKTMKAIVDAGHAIGMHSVTHVYEEIYASEEAFFNDLYKMQGIIEKATGVKSTLMRFPGGSSNKVSKFNPGIMTRLTQAVTDQGFQYFDWNVSSGDAGETKDTDRIVSNVINGIGQKKYAVVLQHDIYKYSVDAVEQILIWGIQNGYSFQALTPSSPTCHHPVNN